MKAILRKVWGALTAYPRSYDDYIGFGRWLVYKKLLVLLGCALLLLAGFGAWWLLRPEEPFTLPVFYELDDRLKTFSGEAVLVDEQREVVYRGQVLNGLPSGQGRRFQPPGERLVYEGDFSGGRYDGLGKLYQDGELVYQGEFCEGDFSGSGTLYQGEELLYQGGFAHGLYSGSGSLFQKGRLVYRGGFLENLYHGEGTLYGADGAAVYTGGFAYGQFEGEGTRFDPSGRAVYQGGFRNGLYDGTGCLYAEDGRLSFQGSFVQGIPDRFGSLYNAQGQLLYEGNIREGKPDFLELLGLPIPEVCERVRELPVLYYGGGYVGYLYQELGFACISRYDYTGFRTLAPADLYPGLTGEEGPPEPDSPSLFAQPADNLVANTLLVTGAQFFMQVPDRGVLLEQPEMTGFAAFLESRLAGIDDPLRWEDSPARTVQRGDHLYEVVDLPERAEYNGVRRFRNGISYLYREQESSKGGVPGVIFLEKARVGG